MNKTEKQIETLNTALERYKGRLAGAKDEIAEAQLYARDKIRAMKEQMSEVQMSSILGVIAGVGGTAIMNKLSLWLTEKWPVLKPFRKWTLGIASAILLYLANMVKDPAQKAMLFSAAGGMAGSLLIPFINKMIGAEEVATSGADEDSSTSGVDPEIEAADNRYCDQAEDLLYGAAASGLEPGAVIAGVETGVIPPALIPLLIQAGQQFAPVAQDLVQQLQRRLREAAPEKRRAMRKTAQKARKVLQEPRVQQDIERLLLNALRALLPPAPAAPAVAPAALMPALKDAGALVPTAPEAAGWRERVERRQDRREARQDVLTPTAEAPAVAPAVAPAPAATAAADVLMPA